MLLLQAENLSKSLAKRPVLRSVSLTLKAGEVLGVIGESGCGKSTLARVLTGLLPVDQGNLLYGGRKPETLSPIAKAQWIQLMFQDPAAALHPRLRIGAALMEVLIHVCQVPRAAAQEELNRWWPKLGLPPELAERFPHQLSGGQKQRVCLLRALLLKPKVLVCDEPLTALDRMTQGLVLGLLQKLQEELGFAMIFISHDISTVRTLADRVAVMYAGQWLEFGSTEDVLRTPSHPYTHFLLQSLPKLYRDPHLPSIPIFSEASASALERGCPLIHRCPFAIPMCQNPLPDLNADRRSRCHRTDVLSPV